MSADPVEEAAERLYALPLEEFVAERGAAAKALRAEGEKEAAATVAKLPKPSQVAWAANQLAREGADALLEAGEALREAQLGGGGRDAVRAAATEERKAVDALVRRAAKLRPLSRDALDRLRALLHAVAADDELREVFTAGRLVSEPSGGGAWPLGGFVAPAPSSRGRTKGEGGREARRGGAGAPAERKSGAARRRGGGAERKGDTARGRRGGGAEGKGESAETHDRGAERERETAARRERDEERRRKAAERQKREAARRREEAERRKLERRLKAAREAAEDARMRLEAAQEGYESAVHEVARIEEQLG